MPGQRCTMSATRSPVPACAARLQAERPPAGAGRHRRAHTALDGGPPREPAAAPGAAPAPAARRPGWRGRRGPRHRPAGAPSGRLPAQVSRRRRGHARSMRRVRHARGVPADCTLRDGLAAERPARRAPGCRWPGARRSPGAARAGRRARVRRWDAATAPPARPAPAPTPPATPSTCAS